MDAIWINKGVQPFGGGNRSMLIHTGQSALYETDGILEETIVHELTHTSLDADYFNHPDWRAAQNSDPEFISTYARDFPDREDLAESFLMWIAVRYRPDQISTQLKSTIEQTIPGRLTFFDNLGLDMSPLTTGGLGTNVEPYSTLPANITLDQNHPNPFKGSTTIDFEVRTPTSVHISVLNTAGREITVLENAGKSTGKHSVLWNGRDAQGNSVPSGVYYYRIVSDLDKIIKPMSLVR